MRKLFIAIALLACTSITKATTYTAAGCSQAQIQAIINTEQASKADGDIIAIPTGTCTWTGAQNIVQTFTNSVTIQGAGAISSTGHGSGNTTTGTDLTVIIDNTASANGSLMKFTTTAGKSFRFTGIAILGTSSSVQEGNGLIAIGGASTAVRLDHNHFFITDQNHISQGPAIVGNVQGVADHNYFNTNPGNNVTNDIGCRNGLSWNGGTDGLGNQSWADTEHWGTSQFFFIEDNSFFDGDPLEIDNSGRCVFRYNGMSSSAVTPGTALQIFWHGQQTGANRGGRAMEIYNNTFQSNENGGANRNACVALNSGTALVWGNTCSGSYDTVINVAYNFRNQVGGGGLYQYPAPPLGWGFCGSQAGGPTNWDRNLSSVTGYSCLGMPGRGKGDLLSGTNFATLVNSTTGTVAWPHEALSPVYVWMNIYNSTHYGGDPIVGNGCQGTGVTICTENTDFYQHTASQTAQTSASSPFNGTTTCAGAVTCGVGWGVTAFRPTTCTAGFDTANSVAAPGVAYWDTTTSTLYVCNPTNTWTAYYTPYTYPHPLAGGVTTCANPTITPGSEIFFNTFNASISAACTSIIYTTNGTTPTASGVCAAVNGTLYTVPISISTTTTLSAIACQSGNTTSGVTIANYTLSTPAPAVNMLMGSLWLNPLEGK